MIDGETTQTSRPSSPLSALYDSFLTLIYPLSCQVCRKSVEHQADGIVCTQCWFGTPIFTEKEMLCSKCGAFLIDAPSNFETFCRRCDKDFYDKAIAIGKYEQALLMTILNLKHTPFIPQTLTDLFLQTYLQSTFSDADVLIPVPLSTKRFAERGFNQADLIAEKLAQQTGLPLDKTSLRRKTHTEKSRRGMDRKARIESVKNAFEVIAPRLIENKKVLLIDDVFTSGATVSNCAKALKKVGADRVYVLTVARA